MAIPDPRVSQVAHKDNVAVALADDIARGFVPSPETVEPYLVKARVPFKIKEIIAVNDKWNLHPLNTGQEVRVVGPGENEAVK